MPTCNLTIDSIAQRGLASWIANQPYEPIGGTPTIKNMIVDPGGNFQLCTTGGTSGATIPTFASVVGDTTSDGEVTWTCVQPYDHLGDVITYPVDCKLGSTLMLSWTSTGANSADINGVSIPVNGTQLFSPSLDQFGSDAMNFGDDGNQTRLRIFQAPAYTLTVTGDDGTATSTVYFLISFPVALFHLNTYAPVGTATPGEFGAAAGGTPVPPDLPDWTPSTQYAAGQVYLDSNGNGELALMDGVSAATPPTWAAIGDNTTETTGLEWQNIGPQYPAICIQRGFGELWEGGQSTIVFAYEGAVLPQTATGLLTYDINTTFNFGDVVKLPLVTHTHSYTGIPIFKCVQTGVTGPTAFYNVGDPGVFLVGQIFPESLINFGGTVVWQYMGLLRLYLGWEGTSIQAPDDYTVGNVLIGGLFDATFDGTPKVIGPLDYTDAAGFLADPSSFDQGFFPFQTETIPTAGVPPLCPTWISLALGTGYINESCAAGFEVDVSGTWATFLTPFDILPPLNGNIIVNKVTSPTGSGQQFSFTSNYGSPFTLTDGQSNNSGSLSAGTYSVTEAAIPGWTTTTDIDPTAIVVTDSTVSITFTNTVVPGNIVVVKKNYPSGFPDLFTFTPSWGAPFTLTDGGTHDSGPLAAGTYSIVETPSANWRIVATAIGSNGVEVIDPTAIVLKAGQTVTITFSNYRLGGGILALDEDMTSDNGIAIVSRYATYGFASDQDRDQLQLTKGRLMFPYSLCNISGGGKFLFTVWPETFSPNPYPCTQAPFTLVDPLVGDVNIPIFMPGTNRAFIQFDSDGAVGTNWTLTAIDLGVANDVRMLITGRNP